MKGNTAHRDGFACRRAPGSERNVQQVCGLFGIREKQLIEVAHAIEQEFIRVLGLDSKVLAHDRRMLIG